MNMRLLRMIPALVVVSMFVSMAAFSREAEVEAVATERNPAQGLDEMTIEELEAESDSVKAQLSTDRTKSHELRIDLHKTKLKVKGSSSEVKALAAQIEALRDKIEEAIAQAPEVVALGEEISEVEEDAVYLAKRKRAVSQAIAAKKETDKEDM